MSRKAQVEAGNMGTVTIEVISPYMLVMKVGKGPSPAIIKKAPHHGVVYMERREGSWGIESAFLYKNGPDRPHWSEASPTAYKALRAWALKFTEEWALSHPPELEGLERMGLESELEGLKAQRESMAAKLSELDSVISLKMAQLADSDPL